MSNVKKIGIITLPLTYNIGGIIQVYALQYLCRQVGFNPYIITRRRTRRSFLQFVVWLKWKCIYLISRINRFLLIPILRSYPLIATQDFKNRYLPNCNHIFFSDQSISRWVNNSGIHQFICGSDQIWNPGSWPSLKFAFAQFKTTTKSFLYSYAPSLGHSENRFSSSQTQQIAKYLNKFKYISCREKSGVDIISKMTTKAVSHVLDPTFLIHKDHYCSLCDNATFSTDYNFMFIYLLDISKAQCQMISNIARKHRLIPFTFYPLNYKSIFSRNMRLLREYNIRVINVPSPENWLKAIQSADFVLTDSFHGTVFSLIFNTPFISLINSKRGAARFLDLQDTFNIHNLFVDQHKEPSEIIEIPIDIDWLKINSLIRTMSDSSFSFLERFSA